LARPTSSPPFGGFGLAKFIQTLDGLRDILRKAIRAPPFNSGVRRFRVNKEVVLKISV
jgi:hypothetical protein